MDLNLREAILQNISSNTQEELEATVVDAMQKGEEKMLPGLGVLFELIWSEADQAAKEDMINALDEGVKQATSE